MPPVTGVPVVPKKLVTFADWITDPGVNAVITDVDTAPHFTDVTIPGVMSKTHFSLALTSLVALKNGEFEDTVTAAAKQVAVVTAAIQLMTSYSTSPSTPADPSYHVMCGKGQLSYGELRTSLNASATDWGYPNVMRAFGRYLSVPAIQLTASGKVQPNIRVCTAHGLPEAYYPFAADFLIVDARRWGYESSVAALMGRMVALHARPRTDNEAMLNLFERNPALRSLFGTIPSGSANT